VKYSFGVHESHNSFTSKVYSVYAEIIRKSTRAKCLRLLYALRQGRNLIYGFEDRLLNVKIYPPPLPEGE
jgi:hypothetical protein